MKAKQKATPPAERWGLCKFCVCMFVGLFIAETILNSISLMQKELLTDPSILVSLHLGFFLLNFCPTNCL